jgi:hypothetical protein
MDSQGFEPCYVHTVQSPNRQMVDRHGTAPCSQG